MKRTLLLGGWAFALLATLLFSSLAPTIGLAAPSEAPVFRLHPARPLGAEHVGNAGDPRAPLPDIDRPLSLAVADLDEDGVPDLVAGYGTGAAGYVAVYRGNLASIMAPPREVGQPGGPEPFLSPALVFDVPVEPTFLGAGDFDNDGNADVVVAAAGDAALHLLIGDGRAGLDQARRIDVPGGVTALLTGEVNRRDGIADLLVGIGSGAGPAVLVYEGPAGALRAEPEIHALPSAPTTLALGLLDAGSLIDLAAGAGSDVWVLAGRDRRLTLDSIRRAEVAPASIAGFTLPAAVASLAIGDFVAGPGAYVEELAALDASGTLHVLQRDRAATHSSRWLPVGTRAGASHLPQDPSLQPALLRARVSGAGEDLIVLDRAARSIALFSAASAAGVANEVELRGGAVADPGGAPVAAVAMRLNGDALDDLVVFGTQMTVPNVVESSVLSTYTVTNLNDSGTGTMRDAIEDANAHAGPDLIVFNIPGTGPFTLQPLSSYPPLTGVITIDGYTQPGSVANSVAAPGFSNAVLMIALDGTTAGPTSLSDGLSLNAGSSVVRGLAIKDWVFSGILIPSAGNIIEGNYIGTTIDGVDSDDNEKNGIQIIEGANNAIGGTNPAARNLISGNADDGIDIGGVGSANVIVRGNYIGSEASGYDAIGNNSDGIQISDGVNITIGGTAPGSLNLLVDNLDDALDISGEGILIQGNMIGPLVDGNIGMPNGGRGVQLSGDLNTIGGTAPAARNVISANFEGGVIVTGDGAGNLVQGNRIGTKADGLSALSNGSAGVVIHTGGNTIGGTALGAGNLISANAGQGVLISQATATGNQVQGNLIGTDITGGVALGNALDGVSISGAPNNTIGGADFGGGNLISGNYDDGVQIVAASATGNIVRGNVIGTDPAGIIDLGNAFDGVFIIDSSGNTVGGSDAVSANYVAGNNANGLVVQGATATANRLIGNYVWNNSALGIDLGRDGITVNDPGDGDVGSNQRQNFPQLNSAQLSTARNVTIAGTLSSAPSTSFVIEYFANPTCDPAGNGEGEVLLLTTNLVTGASGNATLNQVISDLTFVPAGITATATSPAGDTSEFSVCRAATCPTLGYIGETLMLSSTDVQWGTPTDIWWAKGHLSNVETYGTIADGGMLDATSFSHLGDTPLPDQGLYYIIRPFMCGSWQFFPGSIPERDVYLP